MRISSFVNKYFCQATVLCQTVGQFNLILRLRMVLSSAGNQYYIKVSGNYVRTHKILNVRHNINVYAISHRLKQF